MIKTDPGKMLDGKYISEVFGIEAKVFSEERAQKTRCAVVGKLPYDDRDLQKLDDIYAENFCKLASEIYLSAFIAGVRCVKNG